MAIIKDNILTEGLSGMIGNVIVFRQLRGKTIIANRPSRPRFQSELQRENRLRFREASAFAKQAMQDPETKERYRIKARKLKLPNAYTAALTDYMRKPAATVVKYKGGSGGSITIMAAKKGFSIASVTVTTMTTQGIPLATRTAALKDWRKHEWTLRLTPDLWPENNAGSGECVSRIMVTATDHTGNTTRNVLAA
jgi:hypothetical protein